jgi:hypothetical protein
MIRTQIQLTEAQSQILKKLSRERDISISALIRQGVDLLIEDMQTSTGDMDAKWRHAWEAVGQFHSDVVDLSTNHDDYFAETIDDAPSAREQSAQ